MLYHKRKIPEQMFQIKELLKIKEFIKDLKKAVTFFTDRHY